ncbi:MAG: HAMP domain-containing protein [Candidatus Eisenbacteria bacterium]|uniref:histidine kinase n=1 Tax=Eiseniibacteriota bacterium TaxID=2212470 RepID=A0A9D6LBN1_UNCEI|nr:HAMP domain-containing protein [Candidatus Eisenbacteria bacterium]
MTLSLRGRLFVTAALVVAVAIALVTVLAGRLERGWIVAQHEATLERTARQVALRLAAEQPADPEAFAAAMGALIGLRVTLIDATGHVLGDSDVPPARLATLDNHAGRPEVLAVRGGGVGRALRHSRTLDVDLLYVAVPAPAGGRIATVRLAEPLTAITALDRSRWRLSLAGAALALVLTAPIAFWVSGRQVERVAALEQAARRLGAGDREARARERPADEIGRLGAAINAMAAELRARLTALERESEERDRMLVHLSDGVALIDDQGRVVRMNRSLAVILGAPAPAPPGTAFPEFVRSPELDELLREARGGGRPLETDLRLWAPEPRLVHASATPLVGDAVLLVLHDLTEVERLHRVRQDFVANVSHELRTPLTSLRGYAETLLDGGLDDRERREGFVRVIRDQATRLEALVEDLLSLAELERPGLVLRPQPFAWGDAVRAQGVAFRGAAEKKGIEIVLEGEAGPEVTADRARVEAAVANLVDNAIKYTEKGRVTVRWGSEGPWAWCEVEDTGQGIPEADQPRVFERFYRVDKARSRDRGGTGLGLAIVKHIAAAHGGDVAVRSAPGAGSTFRFTVPRAPNARA